ncbi:MAG: lysophospholipid acyltransferase family protein [Phycisphaerales bacterium]|nr:MAG: lysophospholipid acyltransferase family protein [Phycisphaerales bacterium]
MPAESVAATSHLQTPQITPVSMWERCSFAALRVAVYGVARCLTLPGLYRCGQVFGFLEWAVNYRRRRRFAARLRSLLGDGLAATDVRKATLDHFIRVRCDKIIYLILDLLPREKMARRFEIVNRHLLDEALARGRGAYIALSHHGAHHVAALMMSLLGYKVAGVRDRREGAIRRYIQSMYEQKYDELRNARIIYSDSFPRDIYRCFRDNFTLGSALDIQRRRDAHLKTAEVDFFGGKHRFLTGTIQIALRCGATILQGFIISDANFRYRFELHGPLADPSNAEETPELLDQIMRRYATNIERYIRHYPAQISKL